MMWHASSSPQSLPSITLADWSICVQDKEPSSGPCETLRLFLAQHQSSLQERHIARPSAQTSIIPRMWCFTFNSHFLQSQLGFSSASFRQNKEAWCCASTDASAAEATTTALQTARVSNSSCLLSPVTWQDRICGSTWDLGKTWTIWSSQKLFQIVVWSGRATD